MVQPRIEKIFQFLAAVSSVNPRAGGAFGSIRINRCDARDRLRTQPVSSNISLASFRRAIHSLGIALLMVRRRAAKLKRRYSRWLTLNPRRARPPATMRATQLTDFGTDQSPMMRFHSAKIRTKWNSATTAKIRPAIKENVFWSMANQLNRRFLRGDSAVTCSSFFLSIKYPNELPNWTTTQLGVLLDVATITPSSWVAARRIVSPMLMLMSSSFRLAQESQ